MGDRPVDPATGPAPAGLPVGAPAPDLTLRDQFGQTIALSQLRGSRAALLVFYPWAFSRVCGSELAALKDELADAGSRLDPGRVVVAAVSCDSVYSLRVYAEMVGIEFELLSDHWPHGAAARAYGVFDEERGVAHRSTYLVGPDGTVAWAVHNPDGEARSIDDYAAALARL